MSITHLTYEETLRALQKLMGETVAVSISDADTEFMAASIVGPLRRATEADMAAMVPELEGDFAGESILFFVGSSVLPPVGGSFTVWRDGFQWGRLVEHAAHQTVSMQIAGVQIRVRPAAGPLASKVADAGA